MCAAREGVRAQQQWQEVIHDGEGLGKMSRAGIREG